MDVALAAAPAVEAGIERTLIWREPVVQLGAPSSAGRVFLRSEDADLFRACGVPVPADAQLLPDLALALALVSAGHGTAFVLHSTVAEVADTAAPSAETGIEIDFALAWTVAPAWLPHLEWCARTASVPEIESGDLFIAGSRASVST
ncbi:hypothetical protein J2X85_001615 [Microbacterium trichothecenolyticum]|uniref:hypothetical protein n=1 Tax=Microbacterium trichothecenolyticum TaxID=69370 RepID=UPI002863F94C|nr:hypothetical protein [Microbacterium trichothecenolyticum]MDR7184592.1 hypothetical protein [Microbacterium trichothecenolyticum]